MSVLEGTTLSAVRKMKIDQLRNAYFELTGQSETSLTLKADLISAVERLLMDRAHRAYAAQMDRHRVARNAERRKWQADNFRAREAVNSVFDGWPPMPLYGDDCT